MTQRGIEKDKITHNQNLGKRFEANQALSGVNRFSSYVNWFGVRGDK